MDFSYKAFVEKRDGLLVCGLLAMTAYLISLLPIEPFTVHRGVDVIHPVEPMIIAVVLGLLLSIVLPSSSKAVSVSHVNGVITSLSLSERFVAGAHFSIASLLPLGIVLMGVRFSLSTLVHVSLNSLMISLICVVFAYALTQRMCRWFNLDKKLTALIAIGTTICGSAAIIAASSVIKSSSIHTTTSMGIISLYGLLGIFIFPLIGHLFQLSEMSYGIWSGVVIQAVPQVVAAGFAYGVGAGQIAVVVKMVRVLLLAPMVIVIGIQFRKQKGCSLGSWSQYCPGFILFFLLMIMINTLGWIDAVAIYFHLPIKGCILSLSSFLMTVAMAGIGMNTDVVQLCRFGGKPLAAGGIAMFVLAAISLLLIHFSAHLR
jgi:uncharacterized integral membrane protein (TIGR00698 family)